MGPASSIHVFHVMKKKKEKRQREGVGLDLIKDDVEGLYNLGHTTSLRFKFFF